MFHLFFSFLNIWNTIITTVLMSCALILYFMSFLGQLQLIDFIITVDNVSWSISGSMVSGLDLSLSLEDDSWFVSSLQHWFCPRNLVIHFTYNTTSNWELLWACVTLLRNHMFSTLIAQLVCYDAMMPAYCLRLLLPRLLNITYSSTEVFTTTHGTH